MKAGWKTERRLTWLAIFHVASLVGVTLLAVGRQYLMRQELRTDAQDSLLINVAGRQRMLSQALAKSAAALLLQTSDQGRQTWSGRLRDTASAWRDGHDSLLKGNASKKIPQVSAAAQERLHSLEPVLNQLATDADQLSQLAAHRPLPLPEMEMLANQILASESTFLTDMEETVSWMQHEAETRLRAAERHQERLLLALLLVVALEGWFIFRPAVLTTQHLLRSLGRSRREFAEQNKRLNGILDSSPLAIVTFNAEGLVEFWGTSAERMFGWAAAEVLGKPFPIVPPDGWNQFLALKDRLFSGEHFTGIEAVRRRKDGSALTVSISAAAVRNSTGMVVSAVGLLEDISALKAAEQARAGAEFELAQKTQILESVLKSMVDSVMVVDASGAFILFNDTAKKSILAASATKLQGPATWSKAFQVFLPDGTPHPFEELPLVRALRGEAVDQHELLTRSATTDEWRYLSVTSSPLHDSGGKLTGAVAVSRDVTRVKLAQKELSEANEKLQQLAALDGLTGIANRRAFSERLTLELARLCRHGRPLSLALIDVDLFKLFNDSYGHPAGDVVLHRVAQIISVGARATDLVARYGGEEFVVILPETDAAGALLVAQRIGKAVRDAEWQQRKITVSIGVATERAADSKGEQLLEAADGALYQAKRDGRDCVVAALLAPIESVVGR